MFGDKSSKRFDVVYNERSSGCKVLVDKETGVHYLYVWAGYGGGLTPLLDKDGKPVVNTNYR